MTKARRILAVTAGLAATGAVVGAVIGAATLFTYMVLSEGIGAFRMSPMVLAFGGGVGGVIGLVFAPVASWTLLRRVPLGRAIVTAAIGTVLGAFAGGVAIGPVLGAVAGFFVGVSYLRIFEAPRLPAQSPAHLLTDDSTPP